MRKKLHGLKKVKVRQTWNKYNLYNLTRMTIPSASEKTFFQQKWNAKALTRAYHGEHIRERQWQRMFRTHMPSVAPLDHKYLAEHDGSEMAAGRGSGLDERSDQKKRSRPRTPYMHMVYHPTERRLDTAIFRALFASSTRQARQFVVHGAVKVNGKKMIYPGYLLNPGDMFSVDPERVMFATGARKDQDKHPSSSSSKHAALEDIEEEVHESEEDGIEDESVSASSESAEAAEEPPPEDPKKVLKTLLSQAKAILSDPKEGLSAKRKQDLRAFQKTIKQTLSRSNATTSITDDLEAQLLELTNKLNITSSGSDSSASTSDSQASEKLSKADEEALKAALERARENPIDDSKPYATPWRPRDYMSAFAFIPRYLEVNQNICSAVYLRHPVARPGLAEVPTPFHGETNQLAFNWYLRRR